MEFVKDFLQKKNPPLWGGLNFSYDVEGVKFFQIANLS